MERKFLEELEIVDGKLSKESVDKVLNEYHAKVKDKEDKIKTLEQSEKDLKSEITTRDKDIKALKELDADGLKTKLEELQGNYDKLKTESETNLVNTRKELLLENALSKVKAKDLNDIKRFLDMEKITLDNENLIGLDNQIEELTKSKSYLFNVEEEKAVDLGVDHNEPTKPDDDAFVNSVMGL